MTRLWLLCAVLGAAAVTAHAAESFPTRPIRMIVPFPPGASTNDLLGRGLAQRLTKELGQQVVVDNRAGAGGTLGSDMVAKAAPDGYTLLSTSAGTLAVAPSVFAKLPYDPVKDFTPIGRFASTPYAIAVSNQLGATSVKELIALAKAKPGRLTFGSSGTGGSPHLCGELFNSMAGVQITHVPYKGAGVATIALASGEIDMFCTGLTALTGPIKSGRVRGIGMASLQRSALMPQMPTVAEQGIAGFEVNSWSAVMAPPKTPPAIVRRLYDALARVMNTDDMKNFVQGLGSEVSLIGPQAFTADLKAEIAKWAKVVKAAGIKPE